jgi:hypothetical protein
MDTKIPINVWNVTSCCCIVRLVMRCFSPLVHEPFPNKFCNNAKISPNMLYSASNNHLTDSSLRISLQPLACQPTLPVGRKSSAQFEYPKSNRSIWLEKRGARINFLEFPRCLQRVDFRCTISHAYIQRGNTCNVQLWLGTLKVGAAFPRKPLRPNTCAASSLQT